MKALPRDLEKVIKDFENETGSTMVYITMSGSKLYGTDTPTSDTDYKGIYIPSTKSVLLKNDKPSFVHDSNTSKEKNSKDDIDFTAYSIYHFFNSLAKSETGAIDMLYSMYREDTKVLQSDTFVNYVKANIDSFKNSNMKSFIGYALGQTKKFGIKGARYDELTTFVDGFRIDWGNDHDDKLETKFDILKEFVNKNNFKYIKFITASGSRNEQENRQVEYISVLGKMFEGTVTVEYFYDRIKTLHNQFGNRTKTIAKTDSKTDFKALSHALRIALEVQELLETGFIKFPLSTADHIRDIKQGLCEVDEVIDEVQVTLQRVDELLLETTLPETADTQRINEMILELLSKN